MEGGDDGLELIRKLIPQARDHLTPEGLLVLESDPTQIAEISSLLSQNGFADLKTERDLAQHNRVISGVYVNETRRL